MEAAAQTVTQIARKHLRNTWIHRIPITSWVYKKLIHFAVPMEERSIVFRGHTLWVNTKDTSMVPSIISGDYEAYELDVFSHLIKPRMTVLDIGANIGIYSILAAQKVSKVYSFEPVPENLGLLNKNIASNKLKQKVDVIPAAVGEKNGTVEVHVIPDSLGTHGIYAESEESVSVRLIAIDDFVKKRGLKVDLIKIDIEGYEPHALAGALQTLKKQRPILLMEFNSSMIKNNLVDPLDFAKQLHDVYGYCYWIDEKKKSLIRIDAIEMSKLINENVIFSPSEIKIRF